MRTKKISRFIGMLMAVAMLVGSFSATNVFAAEPKKTVVTETVANDSGDAVTRAGTETLPLGWYLIQQHFTITNNNLSPVKTVSGRYMKLKFSWMVSTADKGLGGETITIKIKDATTGRYINNLTVTDTVSDKWILMPFECTYDLGYAGRKIQIFTDVSSSGSSNGNYRSADFYDYQTYVYN